MGDKTLLDMALGTADPTELTMSELEQGVITGVITQPVINTIWGNISDSAKNTLTDLLRSRERTDLSPHLISKMIKHSVQRSRKIRIDDALWYLRQDQISLPDALSTLRNGIYRTRGIPIDRFFRTCMALQPHMKDWFPEFMTGADHSAYAPLFALGAPLPYSAVLTFGLPFREDAPAFFREHGIVAVIRRMINVASKKDLAAEFQYGVISRSVCPRALICSVILGHPDLDDEIKVHALTRLANEHLVPLDNYLQMGTIPREMFTFADLREHCRLSEHYVKEYKYKIGRR